MTDATPRREPVKIEVEGESFYATPAWRGLYAVRAGRDVIWEHVRRNRPISVDGRLAKVVTWRPEPHQVLIRLRHLRDEEGER